MDSTKEEDVEYVDERVVCRHTCEFMEWVLVLALKFVRRHRQRAEANFCVFFFFLISSIYRSMYLQQKPVGRG